MSVSTTPGSLYVVATPIGNLGDIGARAAQTLADVDLIAAEDTRHTRRLLGHLGLTTQMVSLHDHNEHERTPQLVAKIAAGCNMALVSDAGTPLVSDPGFRLVRAARAASLPVLAVPGPCAAIAALSIAGLPSDRFVFEGFLPPRAASRRRALEALCGETRTAIFYVPPRQLKAQLRDAVDVLGEHRPAGLARELTKVYESYYGGTLGELLDRVQVDDHLARGELVLLIGASKATSPDTGEHERLLQDLLAVPSMPLKSAVDIAARFGQQPRNKVYQRALEIKAGIDRE